MGCAIAVIKLGKKGLYIRTGTVEKLADIGNAAPADPSEWAGKTWFAPSYFVEQVVSTAGAGDASIAGVLSGLLSGQSSNLSLQLGCAAAAQKIQIRKSFGGIDKLSNLLPKLETWKQENIAGIPESWIYDIKKCIWKA